MYSLIIDLTLSYSPAIAGFSGEVEKTIQRDGWNASMLHIYSHAGTHIDAPIHFGSGDLTVDELPVERLMGRAWVVNICIADDQQMITKKDFEKYADKIEYGDSIIIKTGWHQFVYDKKYRKSLPRISEDLAHWFVEKRINMLVVESPSIADVNNIHEVALIHRILFNGSVIIVEGITNTGNLTAEMVEIIALPLKIERGDGARARVIAIQKD